MSLSTHTTTLKHTRKSAVPSNQGENTTTAPIPEWCEVRGADLLLRLRVQPRAAREGFDGVFANCLRLRVNAPPVDDAANIRVVELLSELMTLPRSSLQIVRGAHAREKYVLVRGAGMRAREIAHLL